MHVGRQVSGQEIGHGAPLGVRQDLVQAVHQQRQGPPGTGAVGGLRPQGGELARQGLRVRGDAAGEAQGVQELGVQDGQEVLRGVVASLLAQEDVQQRWVDRRIAAGPPGPRLVAVHQLNSQGRLAHAGPRLDEQVAALPLSGEGGDGLDRLLTPYEGLDVEIEQRGDLAPVGHAGVGGTEEGGDLVELLQGAAVEKGAQLGLRLGSGAEALQEALRRREQRLQRGFAAGTVPGAGQLCQPPGVGRLVGMAGQQARQLRLHVVLAEELRGEDVQGQLGMGRFQVGVDGV